MVLLLFISGLLLAIVCCYLALQLILLFYLLSTEWGLMIRKNLHLQFSRISIYMILQCTVYETDLGNRVACGSCLQHHKLFCGHLNYCYSFCCLLGSLSLPLYMHG